MHYVVAAKDDPGAFEAQGMHIALCKNETVDEAAVLQQTADSWHIEYSLEWHCCARSDGGIDHREDKENCDYRIAPESVVLDGANPIGVFVLDHLFVFDERRTHWLSELISSEYVSGWGDVTETKYHRIVQGAVSPESPVIR